MKIPAWLPAYGDLAFRGKCPPEHIEQASFFAKLRREYPASYGLIAIHPRNEGLLVKGQFQAVTKHRIEGMAKGAADIVIPGAPSFVCELKRQDHTKSAWEDGQLAYMEAAHDAGAFVCVALGAAAAWQAFEAWRG
jgi:hypothetical protein